MIFHENRLLAAILMRYHTYLFRKLEKMSQNLSSAAVVIGALRAKYYMHRQLLHQKPIRCQPNMINEPAYDINVLTIKV